MGRVITLASGKGGVGKTSITSNLGIALVQRGFKVLLVDADVAMANLSLLLGMQSSPITLHDVLLGEANIRDATYDGPGGIHFIPSGLSLDSYRRADPERLESVIATVAGEYDYILIDAPAGIEKTVLASLVAAREVLIIVTPDSPSVADALKTKIVAERLNVHPIGIILNLVRNEKGEIKSEELMKMMELPIYGIVPFDDEVRRSFLQEHVMPLVLRKPQAPAAIAIQRLAGKITGIVDDPVVKTNDQGLFASIINAIKKLFHSK